VVTGSPTHFASLDGAMRRLYATEKVLRDMRADDPLKIEVEDRRNSAEFDFLTTVEHAFNRIWYPGRKPSREMGLLEEKLELRTARTAGGRSSLDGEKAVEAALIKAGKYEPSPESKAEGLITRISGNPESNAGGQLWPDGSAFNTILWTDVTSKARENPQFLWLPPGGLEAVRRVALTTGKWRDRESGKIQRGPFPIDKTRVSVTEEGRTIEGATTILVQPLDAGQTPRIHWAEGASVSTADDELQEMRFTTTALRLSFLAVDPKNSHPTGEPYIWKNKITIQHTASPAAAGRRIELFARPSAAGIRYTIGGVHPREGQTYAGPFVVTPDMATGGEVLVRAFAADGDIEVVEEFRVGMHGAIHPTWPEPGDDDPSDDMPPTLEDYVSKLQPAELSLELRQTSTEDFFGMVDALKDAKATAAVSQIQVGLAQEACLMRLGSELRLSSEGIAGVVGAIRSALGQESATVISTIKSVSFPTGADLIAFVETLKVEVGDPRVSVLQTSSRAV